MPSSKLTAGFVLIAALGISSDARAVYTVQFINGVTNVTQELAGFSTRGSDMVGMDVTAFFSDGSSEGVVWSSPGVPDGEAIGTGWSLRQSGDTFSLLNNWRLNNTSGKSISRVLIDAGPGQTIFDTSFGTTTGTAGSGLGRDFTPTTSHAGLNITASYIDLVALTGDAPVGDVFRFLELDFNGIGFASGSSEFRYLADTDNINRAGDLTPIPEPTTLLVLSTGLLGWFARRRKVRI